MKKTITWILVADAAQARIFENDGPGRGLKPPFDRDFVGLDLPSRDLVSDRPGRSFDRAGPGRHAMEPPTDPKRKVKQDFAKYMASVLNEAAEHARFDRLVVVAPPKVLGDLRNAYGSHVTSRLYGELAKDLTHTSIQDLPSHLKDILAL